MKPGISLWGYKSGGDGPAAGAMDSDHVCSQGVPRGRWGNEGSVWSIPWKGVPVRVTLVSEDLEQVGVRAALRACRRGGLSVQLGRVCGRCTGSPFLVGRSMRRVSTDLRREVRKCLFPSEEGV